MAVKQKNLPKEPPILERIIAVRAKLAGTDRDDHLREVDVWEAKAKKALIFMSMKGHEGIDMLITKAREEIQLINIELTKEPTENDEWADAQFAQEALKRRALFAQRNLWHWFLGLFDEAAEDLKIIEGDIALQESEENNGIE